MIPVVLIPLEGAVVAVADASATALLALFTEATERNVVVRMVDWAADDDVEEVVL